MYSHPIRNPNWQNDLASLTKFMMTLFYCLFLRYHNLYPRNRVFSQYNSYSGEWRQTTVFHYVSNRRKQRLMEKSILYQTLLPISNINDYPIFVFITKLTDLKPLSYNNGFCFRFMFVFWFVWFFNGFIFIFPPKM